MDENLSIATGWGWPEKNYILWAYLQPKIFPLRDDFLFILENHILRFIETEQITEEKEKERRNEKRGRKGREGEGK